MACWLLDCLWETHHKCSCKFCGCHITASTSACRLNGCSSSQRVSLRASFLVVVQYEFSMNSMLAIYVTHM